MSGRAWRLGGLAAAVVTVAAASFAATPARSAQECGDVVQLRSFHVEAEPQRKTYQAGDVMRVLVRVSRPANEDPAGQGIPLDRPTSSPASDVPAGVSIWVDSWPMWGSGVTDADGVVRLKIKVPDHVPRGTGAAYAWAEKVWRQECPDVREQGDSEYPTFVVVR